jgi:CRAL/TRIO domain
VEIPEQHLIVFRIVVLPFLRHHLASEPVLVMMRASRFFPDRYTENDLFDHGLKILEVLLQDDKFTVCGVNVTVDFKGLTGVHLIHLSPSFLKRMITFFTRSAPIRIKGIHVVNVAPGYVFICNIIKSLLSDKLKNRVSN